MELRAMDSFGKSNDIAYLDSTKLIEGNTYESIAYVVNSNSGITKRESGYFTFYLKTCDNSILTAQLFEVNNFIRSGFTAKYLIHKPVKVKFIAQIFHGRWSLILEEISVWEGAFDRSLFIGKLDVYTDDIERACRKTNLIINYRSWAEASFTELADGNCGAFVCLANATLNHLGAYGKLWGVKHGDLSEVALYTLYALFEFYALKEKFAIVPDNDLLNLLNTIAARIESNPNKTIILDSCRCVIGLGKEPQYLLAILVNRVIKNSIADMHMIYLHKSMPLGASTRLADGSEMIKL